jgi:hypothetical protein
MSISDAEPIACTLAPSAYRDRLNWIGALTRDALRNYVRAGLTLELHYAAEAHDRVREMVRNEQTCCAFLRFDMRHTAHEIVVTITAPESTRETADTLFEQFIAGAPAQCGCSCSAAGSSCADKPRGTKAAGATALTAAAGAMACAACCVLPFALPAAALASVGGVLAWVDHIHIWVTRLAIVAVVVAWGWIIGQSAKARRMPGATTLYVMLAATALAGTALAWPLLEKPIIQALKG